MRRETNWGCIVALSASLGFWVLLALLVVFWLR